jgi:hypothetical protein
MPSTRHAGLFSLLSVVTGCLFTQPDPPLLRVTSPERASLLEQPDGMLTVTGIAAPNSSGAAIERVAVNGTPARVAADGSFTVTIHVPPGGNLIQTVATDAEGGVATDTRAIAAGERRASGSSNPRAVAVQLAPNMFERIAKIATAEIEQADLSTLVREANPIVDASQAGGCFGAAADVNSVTISDADVSLVPTTGGLQIVATFYQPVITGRMRFSVACSADSRDFTMTANSATVRAKLVFERGAAGLMPRLDQPAFETPGLQVTTSGTIPNAILGILPLERIIGAVTPTATRMFIDPMIRDALVDLQQPHQLEVLGKSVTVAGMPSAVEFSPAGGKVMLDLAFALAGGEASKGFTFTPNGNPQLEAPDGIGLGISDDLINDALAQLVASGLLDVTLPFDGGDFDTITLTPTLAPMINADAADGRLQVLLPDMNAKFLRAGELVTTAAVNAQIAIAVRPAGDGGSVTIDLGKASFAIDAVGDDGAHGMTPSSSFAAAIDLGASDQRSSIQLTIGAIPLPKLGELSLSNVSITADSGYLKAMGTVR